MKRSALANEIISSAIFRLEESQRMISKSMGMLSEEEVWTKPNRASNSMGNILVHLCGNITQYMLSGLGEQADKRQRDFEFSEEAKQDSKELMRNFEQVLEDVKALLWSLPEEQLLKKYSVQGFQLSGQGIILHVVEHLSYHTGQIAYWTKIVRNKDLGFYQGIDLNLKNKK